MSYDVEKDWTTEAGLRAVVIWVRDSHRCGYVGVPAGHPLFGIQYSQPCVALMRPAEDETIGKRSPLALLCAAGDEHRMQAPEIVFDVHGGITYSNGTADYPVPSALWWFGFDCAHSGDRSHGGTDGVMRSLDYCIAECESLASQIVAKTTLPA
ncbi:hypothetical protein [Achromobacter aegrifaciens]|uniref:hypothetical protein n=1 Tax=Achromobacter aegrifaciens TaxID=1287736 RepID=UPI000F73AADA|nr:hypothetical protein [Achromobacter aegrifaciens]RSE90771.1 hypothetical protein EGU54_32265 [Achromobacter aegrifaciens]